MRVDVAQRMKASGSPPPRKARHEPPRKPFRLKVPTSGKGQQHSTRAGYKHKHTRTQVSARAHTHRTRQQKKATETYILDTRHKCKRTVTYHTNARTPSRKRARRGSESPNAATPASSAAARCVRHSGRHRPTQHNPTPVSLRPHLRPGGCRLSGPLPAQQGKMQGKEKQPNYSLKRHNVSDIGHAEQDVTCVTSQRFVWDSRSRTHQLSPGRTLLMSF